MLSMLAYIAENGNIYYGVEKLSVPSISENVVKLCHTIVGKQNFPKQKTRIGFVGTRMLINVYMYLGF